MDSDNIIKMMKLVDLAVGQPKYAFEMQRNSPKPKQQKFAGVQMLDEVNPGRDKVEVVEVDDEFYERTTGVRLVTFQVLFTEGPVMCSRFTSSFRTAAVLDYMRQSGLCVLRHKRIDNKSLTLETNWEIRESVVVECLFERIIDNPIGVIAKARIEGEYHEGDTLIELQTDIKEP